MKQQIVRSYQNGKTDATEKINDLLKQGWVIKTSRVVSANNNIYAYIEYVLERMDERENKNENCDLRL